MDLSILNEMAGRLRNVGLWDNNLADGINLLERQISLLERHISYEGFNYEKIRRPLKSWEDCRRVLLCISQSRFSTFSDIAAPVECCLNLAVCLYKWEKQNIKIPTDIRGIMYGGISVEWSKPAQYVIFHRGGIDGEPPTQ